MTNESFVPRADFVDNGFWIETRQSYETTTALWRLLEIARREPAPWVPRMVLCGEPGVGKSALAGRFVAAARRSVACHIVAEKIGNLDAEQAQRDEQARRNAQAWADEMVRYQGECQALCSPAGWIPEGMLAGILEEVQRYHPAQMLDMSNGRYGKFKFSLPKAWRSPGNDANDPIRRTSLALVDNADRLLEVSKAKRRECLAHMENVDGPAGHRVVNVYLGGQELAEALAECGGTQVIVLKYMPCDEEWAKVAEMIFGALTGEDCWELHRATGGRMGPLLHLAAMRGLKPPYAVPDVDIRRLPSPAATRAAPSDQ